MIRDNRCSRCQGALEDGFLADETSNGTADIHWASGPANRSRWFGVRMKGRRKLAVTAYRCRDCGHLELYTDVPPTVR
jgi:hypothetical protein